MVEATLRKGFSHLYDKRRFYIDEDSWAILAVDLYDEKGQLIGLQESHPISYYDVPMFNSTLETLYHLGWQLLRRRPGQQRADVRFQREARPARFLAAGAASRQLRITNEGRHWRLSRLAQACGRQADAVPAAPRTMASICSSEPITATLPVLRANWQAASIFGPMEPAAKPRPCRRSGWASAIRRCCGCPSPVGAVDIGRDHQQVGGELLGQQR